MIELAGSLTALVMPLTVLVALLERGGWTRRVRLTAATRRRRPASTAIRRAAVGCVSNNYGAHSASSSGISGGTVASTARFDNGSALERRAENGLPPLR